MTNEDTVREAFDAWLESLPDDPAIDLIAHNIRHGHDGQEECARKAFGAARVAPPAADGGPPLPDHERVMEDAYALLWSVTTSNDKVKAARTLLREHIGFGRCGNGIERLCASGGLTNEEAMAEHLALESVAPPAGVEAALRRLLAVIDHLPDGIEGYFDGEGDEAVFHARNVLAAPPQVEQQTAGALAFERFWDECQRRTTRAFYAIDRHDAKDIFDMVRDALAPITTPRADGESDHG